MRTVEATVECVLESEYLLALPGQTRVRSDRSHIVGFVLEAPKGQRCRAVIRPPDLQADDLYRVTAVLTANPPGDVAISKLGDPSVMLGVIDASILSTDWFSPIDLPTVSKERPLVLEYETLGESSHLFIGLLYHVGQQPCAAPPVDLEGTELRPPFPLWDGPDREKE